MVSSTTGKGPIGAIVLHGGLSDEGAFDQIRPSFGPGALRPHLWIFGDMTPLGAGSDLCNKVRAFGELHLTKGATYVSTRESACRHI